MAPRGIFFLNWGVLFFIFSSASSKYFVRFPVDAFFENVRNIQKIKENIKKKKGESHGHPKKSDVYLNSLYVYIYIY